MKNIMKTNINKPKISVIVTVCNIENYIEKCVDSIIDQTYENLEIILVDDGSTDSSGVICDKYMLKDKRIRVIHKKNGGPVSARNAGLQIAEGKMIGFLDGDDYVDRTFYETLLWDMTKNDVDFVHTGFICESESGNELFCRIKTGKYELKPDIARNLIGSVIMGDDSDMHITPSIWSKLYKAEFIKKCHTMVPVELRFGEDLICLVICLLEGKSTYFHQTALYHYVKHQGSLTDSTFVSGIAGIARLYHALKTVLIRYHQYDCFCCCIEKYSAQMILNSIRKIKICAELYPFYYVRNPAVFMEKRIIIYGAGTVGRDFYIHLSRYTSIRITGWVDRGYQRYHYDFAEVKPVEQLRNLEFDMILIAVKNIETASQIRQELKQKWKIRDEMIYWEDPRTIYEDI